jgi:hypothetical protein
MGTYRTLLDALDMILSLVVPEIRTDDRGFYLHLRGHGHHRWAADYEHTNPVFRARSQAARALIKLVDQDGAGERSLVAGLDPNDDEADDRALIRADWQLQKLFSTPGARAFYEFIGEAPEPPHRAEQSERMFPAH